MARLENDPNEVFPEWLTERGDFQQCFPRFGKDPVAEEDRVRLAIGKLISQRNTVDIQALSKWILQIPTMQNLNYTEAGEIARLCRCVRVPADEFVFRQNDPGDACYIIFSGTVDIVSNNEKVASLTKGSSFGEVALEVQGRGRTAGIQAQTDVELLQIRSDDYKRTLQRYHANRKKMVMKWLRREVRLLSELSEHKLKYFETVSVDVTVKKGDVIYHEGDEVGALYFIKSGDVEIRKNVIYNRRHRRPSSRRSWSVQVYKTTESVNVSNEGPSDFFGAELFLQIPFRGHTAIARSDAHLIAINKLDCTSFLFQGKSIEKMAEKYFRLNEQCEIQGRAKLAELKNKAETKGKVVHREEDDGLPLIMLPKFPKDHGTPMYQFPCLMRSDQEAKHPLVRQIQAKAVALSKSKKEQLQQRAQLKSRIRVL